MKRVRFEIAGRIDNLDAAPFLTSRNRRKKSGMTIFHRNEYTTIIMIPDWTLKKYFKYNRYSGVYFTNLTWRELLRAGVYIVSEYIEQYGETQPDIVYIP